MILAVLEPQGICIAAAFVVFAAVLTLLERELRR